MASYKKTQEIFILKTFYSSRDLTFRREKILLGNFSLVAHVVEPVSIIYRICKTADETWVIRLRTNVNVQVTNAKNGGSNYNSKKRIRCLQ